MSRGSVLCLGMPLRADLLGGLFATLWAHYFTGLSVDREQARKVIGDTKCYCFLALAACALFFTLSQCLWARRRVLIIW